MKVSLVIPIYHVEKYVARCINSVMMQDYNEIECILVNDSTPDNSYIICKELVRDYSGNIEFLFVEHKNNQGLSAARNSGIRNSSGDYIFFLDSDDELAPNAISNLVITAGRHKYPEIIMGITRRIHSDGSYDDKSSSEGKSFKTNKDVFGGYLKDEWYVIACNKLIKREVFSNHSTFFKEGLTHEDVLWSFELSLYVKSLIVCPCVTYFYYLLDTNSISRSRITMRRINDGITILEEKAKHLGKSPDDELLSEHIKRDAISLIYVMFRKRFSIKEIKKCVYRVKYLLEINDLQKQRINLPIYRSIVYRLLVFLC